MLSIIIPTYNERDNIILLVALIEKTLSKAGKKFEIIVVDDDSLDRTGTLLKKRLKNKSNIHIFIRKNIRGLGSAILFGIRKAKGTVIIGMDADFNHPPEVINSLVNQLKTDDLVVASRFIKGGGMEEKNRFIPTFCFNFFLKYVLGFPIMDNMSGFYAIKRDKLLKLPLDKIYQGYGEYHLRLIYLANKEKLAIKEVPVYYRKRLYGKSKTDLFFYFFVYIKTAWQLSRSS